VSVAVAESVPVVPSIPGEPLSTATGASSPGAIESATLPSLEVSLKPALLRPHAAASRASAHARPTFIDCTSLG
jgi:hypothetical protein